MIANEMNSEERWKTTILLCDLNYFDKKVTSSQLDQSG